MMTSYTPYSPATSDPNGDWFNDAIAPETSIAERLRGSDIILVPKATSSLFLAGVLATGLSGHPQDSYFPEPSSTHDNSTVQTASDGIIAIQDSSEKVAMSDPVNQLITVQTRFGLTKAGLARACRVERQTIYDWYKDRFFPMGDNARRLDTLFRIAEEFTRRGRPALHPRLSGRLLSTGNTLSDLLVADVLDQTAINRAIDELARLETARQTRSARSIRERLGWKEPSEEQQIVNLDHNLGRREQG